MSRIERGARRLGSELHPHQVELGALLDGRVETTAVQWPRRSGKTFALWSWVLGYCEEVDDALVLTTAQSGVMARRRFMSFARELERSWPEDEGGPRIFRGAGHEALEFPNGSRLWTAPPKEGAARGDAADVVFADEMGELDAAASYDLKAGVLPLLDTRPEGRVILAGTPGRDRAGWFWDELVAGADGRTGVVQGEGASGHQVSIFAAEEGDDLNDEATWLRVHPGIGTLTTLDKMRARREGMDLAQWSREYMGLWPGSSDARAIPETLWEAARASQPHQPDRFGLAADVSPDGSTAALVAAWRDDDGLAWIALLESGTPRQVGSEAVRISRKYRLPVAVDAIGANLELLDGLKRAKPAPKITEYKHGDMATAASAFVSALREGELRHSGQAALDAAAEGAAWRETADSGRLFARRRSSSDVSPIVAASEALLAFDRMPRAVSNRIITA